MTAPARCWRCGQEYHGPGVCSDCRRLDEMKRAALRPGALPVVADLFPDLARRPRDPRAGEPGELFGGSPPCA